MEVLVLSPFSFVTQVLLNQLFVLHVHSPQPTPKDLHILQTPVGTTLFLTLHNSRVNPNKGYLRENEVTRRHSHCGLSTKESISIEMLSKYLSHITSSFYSSILPWKAKVAFPSKNTLKRHRTGEAGLKTLFHSELEPPTRVVHRCTPEEAAESEPSSPPPPISQMWSAASRAFRTTMMGDVIGTESGDCMITYVEELRTEPESPMVIIRCRERSEKRKRQFPPPLTLMRETGEMPWTFKRECNGDGRLTVTAVKMRRGQKHCTMEVRTEDGRVTMRLVPEDDDYCEQCGYPIVVVDDDDDGEMQFNEGFEIEECGLEFEEELAKKVSRESQRCGDLRECVSLTYYASGPDGLLQPYHSDSFPDIYVGRPASAPIRPMTPSKRFCGQFLSRASTFVKKPCEATTRSLTLV